LRNSSFKPPSFLNRQKAPKQDVIVYVDVDIAPGKTGRIGIHQGDDPNQLAESFARTYSLNPKMKESLVKLLQSYLDAYLNGPT